MRTTTKKSIKNTQNLYRQIKMKFFKNVQVTHSKAEKIEKNKRQREQTNKN